MNIAYSFPKPSHALAGESAGDAVRARAMLAALRSCGNEIRVVEGKGSAIAAAAASGYRGALRKVLPRRIALAARDVIRVPLSRRLGARLAEEARSFHAEAIMETHDSLSLAGAVAAEASGLPLLVDDVAPPLEAEHFAGIGAAALHRYVFERTMAAAHRVVAVNRTMQRRLVESGIDPTKIVLVENGVDLTRFEANPDTAALRAAHAIPADNLIVTFVGSFQRYHGAELLIEALAARQRARPETILMIGEGPTQRACEAAAKALEGRADVRFIGRVENVQVPRWLQMSDVTVLPATNDYGNPMKLYEYLAAGTAIVAPDQETVREILEDGRTGLLFAPRNVRALAAALDRLADDVELRHRLQAEARVDARQHSWEERARQLMTALAR